MTQSMNRSLKQAVEETAEKLDKVMDELLPLAEGGESRVIEAMRYSALSGGKRLRPFLVVSCGRLFGVSQEAALHTAAAIEFVHTYSLIHDDLPAMDDDDIRRGMPSCHIKFDEATAILAGDALLTYAFQVLSHETTHTDPDVRLKLVYALAVASGANGMVGGQMMDIAAEGNELDTHEIVRMQRLKTGRMFGIACEAGAILGKGDRRKREALVRFAHDLGLAFQMTDDLLDVEGSEQDLGKATRKDKTAGKATLVGTIGVERAREQAKILADQAKKHLRVFDTRARVLEDIADYVVSRRH